MLHFLLPVQPPVRWFWLFRKISHSSRENQFGYPPDGRYLRNENQKPYSMKAISRMFFFLFLLSVSPYYCLSQHTALSEQVGPDSAFRVKLYKTWIGQYSTPHKMKGVLYDLSDSAIRVSNSLHLRDYPAGNYTVSNVSIKGIEEVKIRKKGNVGKGFMIGTAAGLLVGGIFGYKAYINHDPSGINILSAGGEALFVTGLFGVLGAGIGGTIGSFKISIPINLSQENYNQHKSYLKKYSLKK